MTGNRSFNLCEINKILAPILGTTLIVKIQSSILLSSAVIFLGFNQPVLAEEGVERAERFLNIEKGRIRLKDASGKLVEPLANHGQKATVLFFLTTECPIGNLYSPEINRIVEHYKKQGVTCHAVYAHETLAEIKKHRSEYKLSLSALLDPEVKLAKLPGATVICLLYTSPSPRDRG